MKKIIYIVFVGCIFSFSAAGAVFADTPINLIQNPSLETASISSPNTPNGWNWDYFGNNTSTFTYPVPGHTGVAAKIDMTARISGDAKWFFDSVPVTVGTQYSFSDYYISTVSTMVTVQYTMLDGSFQYQNLGAAKSSPNSWQQFSGSFTVPAGVVKVSVFHRLRKVGSLTVDDYSLSANPNLLPIPSPVVPPVTSPLALALVTATSTSPNLILNPSVESQTGGVPDNWFTDVEGTTTTATFSYPVPGHNGGSAVQTTLTSVDPGGGDAKWIWAPVAVDANGDYTFSEYYMSDMKNVVIVEFNMADGTRQFTNLVVLPPSSTWTQVTKEFNVRPGTVSVTVFDVLRAAGTLTIDDVSLSKLPDGSFSQGLVSVMFDDGYSSFYTTALPELLSRNLVASQNVVSDFINQPGYMTTAQMTEINKKDGFSINSETLSHPFLTSLSDADATNEIQNSRTQYLSMGFTPVSILTYPYGDYDQRIENIAKTSGYIGARGTDLGFNTKNTDSFELRTENVESSTTVDQVKTWVNDAIANKTWLILAFHNDDNQADTYSITPGNFQAILDYLVQSKVRVATPDYIVGNLMK